MPRNLEIPQNAQRIEFDSTVPQAIDTTRRETRARLFQAGQLVRNAVVGRLRGDRSGKRYRVPGKKKWYTASAPGEAPASRTGDLRRSYVMDPARVGQIEDQVAVGSILNYAYWLEKGTKHMHKRPHLNPAYREVQDQVMQVLREKFRVRKGKG